MKQTYTIPVGLCAILFLAIQLFFGLNAYSQDSAAPSVGLLEHLSDNAAISRQKPLQFLQGNVLNQNEKHLLTGLTDQERRGIEDRVEPLAIGVVRDLADPIHFNLNAADAPALGEQRSISGGRLVRVNADTIVWSTFIQSDKADQLRIFFSEGNFPAGVLVNLFSKDGYAFSQKELRGTLTEDGFYTTTTFADYINVEVVIPVASLSENLSFSITKVVHAESRYMPKSPNVDCFEDVNCAYANTYANIGGLKASTAQLHFVDGGYYWNCSGSLLNDIRAADFQPFLLTAHHCFSNQAAANSLEATFDYYTTSCNGATNPYSVLVNGSNLLATNAQSDVTMVLLKDAPGGYRVYLGWTAGSVANDATVHSVNHPAAMVQKYMRGLNKTSPDFTCTGLSTANFHYTRAIGGESVGGSSGGNLVNDGGAVIGQLYGWCYLANATECSYSTFYNVWGKFEVSYSTNNLGYWLYNGGASASMSTSPASSLSFSTLNVGSSQNLSVTVYNTGTVPNFLNLEAGYANITGADASQFSIIGNTYLYLPPGTSGSFLVHFAPTSSGAKTAYLNIPHNANNIASPSVITLTGAAEPCSSVISLSNGGEVNAKTFSKSGYGIWWTSWSTPCGYSCPGNEQIYSFVAPYTGYYSVQVTAANSNYIDYQWRQGSCDVFWNCLARINSTGTYGSQYWTAGTTYSILLDAESTALTSQTFSIIYNPCLNTTPIAGTGAANTATYSLTGNGAWNTNSASACGWYCPGMEQVYSFTPTATGYYSIQVASAGSWVDYMWSTSCGSTGWNCITDLVAPGTYGSMFWTAGVTYYLLLDGEFTNSGPHSFYINPPNPCIGITPISCNQSVSFGASGPGIWNNSTIAPCYYVCPGAEKIFSFVAPTTGLYSINVTAASGWTDYFWSTSCSPTSWTCIRDIASPGQVGSMSWTAGTTYYIMLDDEDNIAGTHTFNIVCPELCHVCNLYDFQISPSTYWQTATSSIDSYGCKNYGFYGYSGSHYTFKTGCYDGATANFDTYLELSDPSCTLLTYNDDGCGYPLSKIEWICPTDGYYYLKVKGYLANFGNFTMAYTTCYTAPVQPLAINGPATAVNGVSSAYSITAVPGATAYAWTFSGGGTIISSGTSITLTPLSSGTLSVIASNACGSSTSSDKAINVIPLNINIQNIVGIPGASTCYSAGQTITVAGAGTYFYVLNGSSVEFVAGHNILFEPGITVYNGGYLRGHITTDGNYCTPVSKFAEDAEGIAITKTDGIMAGDASFKVFPNPTSGNFTLELSSEPAGSPVKVQCYNLLGALIMEKEFISGKRHELTLTGQSPGLYVLKVVQRESTGMQKIIKQ